MLIPLYVLVGVWGRTRRLAATLTLVLYTMAGSLLMLASVVAFGVTQGTFSLVDSGTSDNVWIFLGFAVAFAIKAPLFPFHGWLPALVPRGAGQSPPSLAIVSKTAVYGFLRIGLPKFPEPVEDLTVLVLVLAGAGLVWVGMLAFRAPDPARHRRPPLSMAQMGLIVLGVFALNDLGIDGAVLQSVAHALVSATMFLLVGMVERRCGTASSTRSAAWLVVGPCSRRCSSRPASSRWPCPARRPSRASS